MGAVPLRPFSPHWTDEKVRDVFRGSGEVIRVVCLVPREGRERYAFVDMAPPDAAWGDDALNSAEVEGVRLHAEAYRRAGAPVRRAIEPEVPPRSRIRTSEAQRS